MESFRIHGELFARQILDFSESKLCSKRFQPFLKIIASLVIYFFVAVGKVWKILKPYNPQLLMPSLMGLGICFFGGTYMKLMQAVELFNLTASFTPILEEFHNLVEANEKDNQRDDNEDNIPDVLQISTGALLYRKVALFLRTVNPDRLMTALGAMTLGFFSVIASLKSELLKVITLGNSIYAIFEPGIDKFFVPCFELVLPGEYRKWASPILRFICRTFVISWSWHFGPIISAIHSAIKGGLMLSRNILEYLDKMNIYHLKHEDTYLDEIVGVILAISGLWFQLSYTFALPFPLNVMFFPFTIAEWILVFLIKIL